MTREEAIEQLNNVRDIVDDEAIDMAIESLSTPSGDLISRADAIEAIVNTGSMVAYHDASESVLFGSAFRQKEIIDIIKSLPSADAVHKPDYSYEADMVRRLKESLSAEAKWIPCSERLPKEDEYVGNVCKYYLIQDEYGDMHVAHLSGRGWETIESVKALGCYVVAWMPLPEPYRGEQIDSNT